jgi:hypothetical protein
LLPYPNTSITDQFQVRIVDCPFVGQKTKVDHAVPVIAADQNHGNLLHAVRLAQSERVENLVQRAKPAGKGHQRLRAHHKVHLAQREIMKLKAQLGRDVGIGHLL